MEEKRRESGSSSPATASSASTHPKSSGSPSTEPPAPRRRGQKRKSTSSVSGSFSAPPKRHAREKAAASAAAAASGISSLLPPFHNGPLTRARQLSDTNAVLNAVKDDIETVETQDTAPAEARDVACVETREEFEEFRAALDAEFDAIRSRDVNSHVIPVFAGWFSWTEIHPLEKQTLHSFFNGKSEIRTPKIYMEIRNWIMKKFHANPSSSIELNDLSELSVGDSDARQEVMEFLDHWGLINYHPSVQNGSTEVDVNPSTDGDTAEKADSLVQKMYQFESEQSCPELVPRANMSAQAMSTGLLRESAFAEELIRQEGPSVEYHCNSCSADCSRKRYHCQKQADFDLCTECYNDGKFGSGMSSSDFILMEPGDASGATGGKWTDQETLLLLEALELFKENWNEIAEHVATKTKAQCILHFLQMPIEDVFLNDDYNENGFKVTTESTSTNTDVPTDKDKDTLEPLDEKACKENSNQPGVEVSVDNPDSLAIGSKYGLGLSERKTNASAPPPASTLMETFMPEDSKDEKETSSCSDDVILKALKEAFDAVGCPATPEDNLCFIETGNPVMSLAAFLTQLVEPGLASVSARSSLKLMSASAPGSQLAARHCFILEDPPDHKKKRTVSESMGTDSSGQNAQKLSGESDEKGPHSEENPTNVHDQKLTILPDGNLPRDGQIEKGSDLGDNSELPSQQQDVSVEKSQIAEKLDQEKSHVVEKPDSENSKAAERPKEGKTQISSKLKGEKSDASQKPDEDNSKVPEQPDQVTCPEQVGPKGVNDSQKKALHSDPSFTNPDGQDGSSKVMLNPSSENELLNTHSEVEVALDASKDLNMELNVGVSDKSEQNGAELADPVGVTSKTGEDKMEVDRTENPKCKKTLRTIDGDNVSRLKCAALATLSAAAVKAKLLANQEEDEIKQLATLLIEKQMRKLEIKLSFFTDIETAIMRVREQLERSRQKLFAERAQIIASRLGLPPSARGLPSSHTLNRMPTGLLNSVLRPSLNMAAQRPHMSRPAMTSAPPAANTSAPTEAPAETPVQAAPPEKYFSVGTS